MSLLLHCGAFSTTYDDLLQVKLPETTSTYEPIPHHEIIDTVISAASERIFGNSLESFAP